MNGIKVYDIRAIHHVCCCGTEDRADQEKIGMGFVEASAGRPDLHGEQYPAATDLSIVERTEAVTQTISFLCGIAPIFSIFGVEGQRLELLERRHSCRLPHWRWA